MTGKAGSVTDGSNTEPCRSLDTADVAAFLQEAATRRGNFRLGRASVRVAVALGEAWVGSSSLPIRKQGMDFDVEISADALRQYRSPTYKPNQRRIQANYDRRAKPAGNWDNRGHLDIDPTCP